LRAARINGTSLAYVEKGAGTPVFFVHGSLADFRSWSPQMDPFSKGYRAIAYSRRYHFPNPVEETGGDYSAAMHATDLAALVRSVGPGPAHIVASSFGAYAALLLAVGNPECVLTLTLGEPPLFPWLPELPGGEALLAAFLSNAWEPAKSAFQKGDREQGARFFLDGVLGQGSFDRMPVTARGSILENAAEMTAETSSAGYFSPLTPEQVSAIAKPVLLVNGERSPRMFHVITDGLSRILPGSRRVVIPAASHSMHLDNPRAYNGTVLAFLGEASPAVSGQSA
jgi:non-heme chloroperoxidase